MSNFHFLLYFCSPFSAGFLSQSHRSSNLYNNIITEEAMDTAVISSAGLPVATQAFVIAAKNAHSASKPGIYVPFRELEIGPSAESNPKVVPAFAELPEAYPHQMHTMTGASISQKPQVFHAGSGGSLSAAPLEVSAFRGITSTTFGSGHQMLQPVYPGMVMPTRGSFPPPGMPIAYQKPQVFPGLSNRHPHL